MSSYDVNEYADHVIDDNDESFDVQFVGCEDYEGEDEDA